MNLEFRNTGALRSRPNSEMSIIEQPLEWLEEFQLGWLAHLQKTGKIDWDKYVPPRNIFTPSGLGVNLAESRLILISSSGAYLPASQEPFDAENPLGDYTIRTIPANTPFRDIDYSHTHYSHKYVKADPQVLLPLSHLADMEAGGKIGEITPVFVSFSGYHPNIIRVVKETIPAILKIAKEFTVQAALLVPVGPLCIQSVGLIARALEVNNIATTLTSWDPDIARLTAPPRFTVTKLVQGVALGMPGDQEQQRRVLEATLALLEKNAPQEMVELDEYGEA